MLVSGSPDGGTDGGEARHVREAGPPEDGFPGQALPLCEVPQAQPDAGLRPGPVVLSVLPQGDGIPRVRFSRRLLMTWHRPSYWAAPLVLLTHSVAWAGEPPRPLVVGHRGLLRHAPENTLAGFRACLELRLGFEF